MNLFRGLGLSLSLSLRGASPITLQSDKNNIKHIDPQEIHDGWIDTQLDLDNQHNTIFPLLFSYRNRIIQILIDPNAPNVILNGTCVVDVLLAPVLRLTVPAHHPANHAGVDVKINVDLEEAADPRVSYFQEMNRVEWEQFTVQLSNTVELPSDCSSSLRLEFDVGHSLLGGMDISLMVVVTIQLPKDDPWLQWNVAVENKVSNVEDDAKYDPYIVLDHIVLSRTQLCHPKHPKLFAPNVFVNGWNSWSFSAMAPKFSGDLSLPTTRSAYMHYYSGPNNESGAIPTSSPDYSPLFGDMFVAVIDPELKPKWYTIFGFLSQKQTFGIVNVTKTDTVAGKTSVDYHCPCD